MVRNGIFRRIASPRTFKTSYSLSLNSEKIKQAKNSNASVYCGIDPTATSLHVGHLLQIVLLYRFSLAGFKPLAVIGGWCDGNDWWSEF
ncbi:hypothetical protein [Spiroplasma endosymbiont of Clivina fossor]|uniref:hypothetical protein n=1 Tax=Spiroplasma endosymbiont of Clivina fossor TaxID=3066282 RepID=UPI00313B624C